MKHYEKQKDYQSIDQADNCYQRISVRPWIDAAIFLSCLFGLGNAWAQDRYVDSAVGINNNVCDDPTAPCEKIAHTIEYSAPNDTIHLLGSNPFNESGIDIPHSLVIEGEGALNTTIDAGGADRIFTVNGDVTVIEGVTLLNGDANNSALPQGGAILLETGDLLVNKSRLVDNTAGDGGAIAAVSGAGVVSVLTTIISDNNATASGGGIWCNACDGVYVTFSRIIDNVARTLGGAVFTDTAPMTSWISHLSRNSADAGGGVYALEADVTVLDTEMADNEAISTDGGAIHVRGDLTIQRSTLAGNSAPGNGGGVYFYGEGFVNSANSTWSGNSATLGGALSLITAPPLAQADVLIGTSTFYNNVSTINAQGSHFSGTWASFGLFNSIVTLTGNGACAGITPTTAGQNNLIDDLSCDTGAIGFDIGDVSGLDPNLAFNGGLTRTHLIDPSSNAVDAGLNTACLNPTTGAALVLDQRSFSRPVDFLGLTRKPWPMRPKRNAGEQIDCNKH